METAAHLTDEQLIAAFESTALPADAFTHAAHVRVAWWYLRHEPFPAALARFRTALQRFAAAQGAARKYHETITLAYMILIAERLDRDGTRSWAEFAAAHPDLLARQPSALAPYYSEALLRSDTARLGFVMPDLCTPAGWEVRAAGVAPRSGGCGNT
jgi:hypothetical protein